MKNMNVILLVSYRYNNNNNNNLSPMIALSMKPSVGDHFDSVLCKPVLRIRNRSDLVVLGHPDPDPYSPSSRNISKDPT